MIFHLTAPQFLWDGCLIYSDYINSLWIWFVTVDIEQVLENNTWARVNNRLIARGTQVTTNIKKSSVPCCDLAENQFKGKLTFVALYGLCCSMWADNSLVLMVLKHTKQAIESASPFFDSFSWKQYKPQYFNQLSALNSFKTWHHWVFNNVDGSQWD